MNAHSGDRLESHPWICSRSHFLAWFDQSFSVDRIEVYVACWECVVRVLLQVVLSDVRLCHVLMVLHALEFLQAACYHRLHARLFEPCEFERLKAGFGVEQLWLT